MSSTFDFANWPPSISDDEKQRLTLLATTYALSHGLLYLPVVEGGVQPPAPSSAIHAPIALFPSPIPRASFERVARLQHVYNILYARVAMDEAFLDKIMGDVEGGAGQVDSFTRELWKGWKQLRDEGIRNAQTVHLGIFRSDYLLHSPEDEDSYSSSTGIALKQVEFNTISSSFGTLSERAAAMHRYLYASTGYFNKSPHLKPENFPANETTKTIVNGLASAHRAYGIPDAYILFVVQENERNVFDQRWLEYSLLENHSIRTIRQTLTQLSSSASLSPSRALLISPPLQSNVPPMEISTIYFRATYTPTDFPTQQHWDTRILLQRSRAINCPSLALQLAGGKKVQQALTRPGVLESFFLDEARGKERFTEEDVRHVRESWVEMWGLDEHGDDDASVHGKPNGVALALARSSKLVLKPQREGGGNNVYKSAISAFLSTLPKEERAAWIAMQLIEPPSGVGNYLVRAGGGAEVKKSDVVSELGMFGWALFGGGEMKEREVETESGGWLVRTKGRESDEGGVAVGFSVLDSVLLVD